MKMALPALDHNDKYWLLGTVVAPIVVWWMFIGRHKYGVKGMN